eukprot:6183793-Amphidinium_carterae.1
MFVEETPAMALKQSCINNLKGELQSDITTRTSSEWLLIVGHSELWVSSLNITSWEQGVKFVGYSLPEDLLCRAALLFNVRMSSIL